jgi:hypothetical protein
MSTSLYFSLGLYLTFPELLTTFCNHISNSFVYLVNYKFESEFRSYVQKLDMCFSIECEFQICAALSGIRMFLIVVTIQLAVALQRHVDGKF